MRGDKRTSLKSDSKSTARSQKRGVVGYSKKTALLEEAITQMNAGKYGRSSAALKELLALDPQNMEARRLFATLHLRLGSLIPAQQAFDSLITEAFQRQDYWLAESLLREYLAAGPRCVPFLEKLGLLYQEKGDALEAVTEYGKAIDILIEDSDAESLQRAAELYKRIRELAPASPVAFRLASLFDAQTGALLVSRSSLSETTNESPLRSSEQDSKEQNSSSRPLPEPVSGVMPWEVEMPPEVLDFSPESLLESRRQESPSLPANSDVQLPEGPPPQGDAGPIDLQVEAQPETAGQRTDVPILEPVLEPASDAIPSILEQVDQEAGFGVESAISFASPPVLATAQADNMSQQAEAHIREQVLRPEPEGMPAIHEQADQVAVVSVENAASFTPSSDLTTEIPIGSQTGSTPLENLLTTASNVSTVVQQEAETGVEYRPVALSGVGDSANGTSAIDQGGESVSSETNPVTREQDQPQPASAISALSPTISTDVSVDEPISDISASPNADQTATNSSAEPWKEPGFSWEALFNKAWDFKERSSELPPAQEEPQAKVEESSALGSLSPNTQQSESDSIEIPERTEPTPLAAEGEAVSTIKPMPWDQIEDTAIPIPSVPVDEFVVQQVAEPVVDHLVQQAEPVEVFEQEPFQPEPAHVPDTSSFSITQPPVAPSSPESDVLSASVVQACYTDRVQPDPQPESDLLVSDSLSVAEPQEDEGSEVITPLPSVPLSQTDFSAPEILPVALSETFLERASSLSEPDSTVAQVVSDAERLVPQEPEALEPVAPKRDDNLLQQETPETETPIDPFAPAKRKNLWEALIESLPTLPIRDQTVDTTSQNQSSSEVIDDREPATLVEPVAPQTTWGGAKESVRFVEAPEPSPSVQAPIAEAVQDETIRPIPTGGVLAESSPRTSETEVRKEDVAPRSRSKLRMHVNRMRFAVTDFVGSCFSTTWAIVATCVGLVVLGVVCVVLGIGTLGLTWMAMEESPSVAFQSFTTIPQRTLSDAKRNGYLLLLGIDAPAKQDAIQAGAVRISEASDVEMGLACLGGSAGTEGDQGGRGNASAQVSNGWFRGSNPVGQFKLHQDTIKGWVSQHEGLLARYAQWHQLPFEDWGYGQPVSPPCSSILFAHQLYLSAGFTQAMDIGVERLETDMETWRIVLGQAKTLPVKMLALQAMNDDIAVASGLLVQPDIESRYVPRLAKLLRPLDQAELSLRWPMQSELVVAKQTFDAQLQAKTSDDQDVYAMVASILPLPKQRRLNDYAEYYDASYKVAGEGQYSALPKWKNYIQFPAASLKDYFTNPIENLVGLKPLPPWDVYNGLVVDTEAHLRLASLQAWIRNGSQDADLLTRIAKAGQGLYDPYTGFPMLVNMAKGALYSVGHDGKDQDADPQTDVVVMIPLGRTSSAQEKASPVSSKSR